jgi:hypothetical protein
MESPVTGGAQAQMVAIAVVKQSRRHGRIAHRGVEINQRVKHRVRADPRIDLLTGG